LNNIKYFNDNLAHDYDRFMPRETRGTQGNENVTEFKIKSELKAKTKPRSKAKSVSKAKAFPIIMATVIVAGILCNLFLRAELSRVSNEINTAETMNQRLMSEKTRLSVELEKKTAVGNLEKRAIGLGMQKQEKTQMNYIFTYDDDAEEISADAE